MPERYLAIETSSPRLSLALGNEKGALAVYTGTQDWRHAESLFKGINRLLRKVRWPIRSLTGVAVSIGPGSFTGIRIGLAAARAIGQFLKVPVAGVSSLETMSAGASPRHRWLAPRIDALRGQFFYALFERSAEGKPRRVLPEGMAPADVWLKQIKRHSAGGLVWISPLKGCYPEADDLLRLAIPRLKRRGTESYRSVLPLYIREAAAVERARG